MNELTLGAVNDGKRYAAYAKALFDDLQLKRTGASILIGSVISAGLVLLPFSTALAENTLNVSAQVIATCNVVGGPAILNFGDYDPGNPEPHDVSTNFSVQCTTETTVGVGLGEGGHFAADTRRMSGQGTFLPYGLFHEDGESPFGDGGESGSRKPVTISDPAVSAVVPVVGIIAAGEAVPTGTYNDSVQVSFEF